VLKNTTSLGAGRLLVAATRIVIAGFIVRGAGTVTFGQYSLVLGMLAVAEWLADFGTTETYVREICAARSQQDRFLRIVTAAKVIQVPVGFGVLMGALLALGYPREVVTAGSVAGLSIGFFAGIVVYRTLFKANLTMEREVAAELLAAVSMIPLVAVVIARGGGLIPLIGCYVVSRGVFFALSVLLGWSGFPLTAAGVTAADVSRALRAAAPIGWIGLLVGVYEAVDILLLSKFDIEGVAYYAAAQRMTWPILLALGSVGATLYPVLASYWPGSRSSFETALQKGVESVAILAGLASACLLAGAELLLGIISVELVPAADVVRVFAALVLVKAVNSTLGPMLYVVQAQKQALQFIAFALVSKVIAISLVAPRSGAVGVALAALLVEVLCSATPAIYLLRRFSGYSLRWAVPVKTVGAVAIAASLGVALDPSRGIVAVLVAAACYTTLVLSLRLASLSELASLVRRRSK